MRRFLRLACLVAITGSAPVAGQAPAQPAPAQTAPVDDTPIFRVSVSLVQLDAVVTDRKGRHVTTLGPEDFEVYQDGRRQPITAATYIELDDQWVDTSGLPPLPAAALRPADAHRTMAVVVDDLRMSFESIHEARRGLGEFFNRQFRPGDAAMLATTSGATRVSKLTSSSTVLRSAVNRLRFSFWGMRAASVMQPIDGIADSGLADAFQERTLSASAILRIEEVIDALKPLPGRKSVVLVSEGFQVFGFGMDNEMIRDALRGMVDRANRAGVVLYAIDPRGLVNVGITAADRVGGGRQAASIMSARSAALRESQDGLRYLAGETGGFAVVNTNDLAFGFRKVMADQHGYYLIGYQPEAGSVNELTRDRFRRVSIKVKRKGLKVRTRAGFYARTTE